jgi:hypothetical protein
MGRAKEMTNANVFILINLIQISIITHGFTSACVHAQETCVLKFSFHRNSQALLFGVPDESGGFVGCILAPELSQTVCSQNYRDFQPFVHKRLNYSFLPFSSLEVWKPQFGPDQAIAIDMSLAEEAGNLKIAQVYGQDCFRGTELQINAITKTAAVLQTSTHKDVGGARYPLALGEDFRVVGLPLNGIPTEVSLRYLSNADVSISENDFLRLSQEGSFNQPRDQVVQIATVTATEHAIRDVKVRYIASIIIGGVEVKRVAMIVSDKYTIPTLGWGLLQRLNHHVVFNNEPEFVVFEGEVELTESLLYGEVDLEAITDGLRVNRIADWSVLKPDIQEGDILKSPKNPPLNSMPMATCELLILQCFCEGSLVRIRDGVPETLSIKNEEMQTRCNARNRLLFQ